MKKNKVMRLSSGLLVLTILTTCIISGTFAKYVTGDKEQDFARAAKWGVTTTISGALFGQHYGAFEADEGTEVDGSNQISAAYTGSVDRTAGGVADTGENIVAPGTKSENMTVSISGTPEVAGKIAVTVDDKVDKNYYSDIWLASGKYGVMTDVTETVKTKDDVVGLYVKDNTNNYTAATSYDTAAKYYKLSYKFELSNSTYVTDEDEPRFVPTNAEDPEDKTGKYYPILWGLANEKSQDDGSQDDSVTVAYSMHNVGEIKAMIESQIIGKTSSFSSHTDLGAQVGNTTINWQWPFEASDAETGEISSVVDGCDTILSKLMAWEANSNYQVVQISEDDATFTGVTKTGPTEDDPDAATYAVVGEERVACLTVGFNLEVTVSQVD